MEYTQLKYFQTVARLGNISKASKELYVTQPNLSKSIARLEQELGMPLFEHRKGKIVLNDYGRIFLSSVSASFLELDKGVRTIQHLHEANQNFLLIGSSINDFLPDMLKDFSTLHPEIGIRQIECSLKDIAQHLYNGSIEIAITSKKIKDDNLEFELLGKKEYVILIGKEHALNSRKSVSIKELSEEKFICDRSRMDAQMLTTICNERGFEPTIAFDVENTNFIYSLLSSNAGICFMPVAQIAKLERDYPDSQIRVVKIEDNLPPAQLGITYRKDYIFSNAAKVLTAYLREWIQDEHETVEKLLNSSYM